MDAKSAEADEVTDIFTQGALSSSKSRTSLDNDSKSMLDHVSDFAGNMKRIEGLQASDSEHDVFFQAKSASSSPPSEQIGPGLTVYGTSSDEVLAAFNFSKPASDSDELYDDLESLGPAPKVTLLSGNIYQKISKRPELLASILLEPANKGLLQNFVQGFAGTKEALPWLVEAGLRNWSAKLPFDPETTSLSGQTFLKTSRNLSPADFTEVDGMEELTLAVQEYLNRVQRETPMGQAVESLTTIVSYILDNDSEDEAGPAPAASRQRSRSARVAFQERLLQSASTNTTESDTENLPEVQTSSSWLHRLAGFREFPGAPIYPPHMGHASQMFRLATENAQAGGSRESPMAAASGLAISSGPFPQSYYQRTGFVMPCFSQLGGFPGVSSQDLVLDSESTLQSTSSGYSDLINAIEAQAGTLQEEPPGLVQVFPSPQGSKPKASQSVKAEKPAALVRAQLTNSTAAAMLSSWEELPPAPAPILIPIGKEAMPLMTSTECINEGPFTAVSTPTLRDPFAHASKEPVEEAEGPAPSTTARSEPQVPAKSVEGSKGKVETKKDPSTSEKDTQVSRPSSQVKVAPVKSKLSRAKLLRSKTSVKLVKTGAKQKADAVTPPLKPKVVPVKPERVIPVRWQSSIRGVRAPIKPVPVPKINEGSYRERNQETVALIQTKGSSGTSSPAPETASDPEPESSRSRRVTDNNANEIKCFQPQTSKSTTVIQFLVEAKSRLYAVLSQEAANEDHEETLDDQVFPSHMYVDSGMILPERPKSPVPSDAGSTASSPDKSPFISYHPSKVPSRTNTAVSSSSKTIPKLTYAEMHRRKLEADSKKAGRPLNRFGYPITPTKPSPLIAVKVNQKASMEPKGRLNGTVSPNGAPKPQRFVSTLRKS